MNTRKKISVLSAPADREALAPILEALEAKRLRPTVTDQPGKDDLILAVLSENLYADQALSRRVLDLVAAGAENVLPLRLDDQTVPETLMNALYARNIIPAGERDAALIAERIAAALPKKKNRLPLCLALGAVALAAVVGVLIWRSTQKEPAAVPVMEETPAVIDAALPEGLTMEELAQVKAVIIVGEQAEFYTRQEIFDLKQTPDWDFFAYRDYENDGAHWYSREDGHEYAMTRYDDLRFLEYMPNLQMLTLARMEAGQLPELRGLTYLKTLILMDSVIPDLGWVEGASIEKLDLINSTGSVQDFSPLTSCETLRQVHIDLIGTAQADLSGFAPPRLNWLWINNGQGLRGGLDLSGLRSCIGLKDVNLDVEIPVRDLSFLSGAIRMEKLNLNSLHELRDISVLESMKTLHDLSIHDCDAIADLSPIAGCSQLYSFYYRTEGNNVFRDASFLAGLMWLKNIQLENVDLPDLEFLREIGARQKIVDFGFAGNVADFSGLEGCRTFGRLTLDPSPGTPLDRILPHLAEAGVQDLKLSRFTDVDLSALPRVTSSLTLDRCGITDLSTIPESFRATSLYIRSCPYLRSLEGFQTVALAKKGAMGRLEISDCPRLTDWSALYGTYFSHLNIVGCYTLPSFADLRMGTLRLERMPDVTDLEFLNELKDGTRIDFELVDMDGVTSLAPLRRFQGSHLTVPPQLAEQAEDLVKAGNYNSYEIAYPRGGWEMNDAEFTLLSLEELETLPPSVLRHVTRVCVAGGQIVDMGEYELNEDWEHRDRNGHPTPVLRSRETGEEIRLDVKDGVVTDLSIFAELTGLRELYLVAQPIQSLDGIQGLSSLETFQADHCTALSDASALFTLQELREVGLKDSAVTSIQGIQNLSSLTWLDITRTKVTDLTPLAECDFSAAMEERGGLELNFNECRVTNESFAALSAVGAFSNLAFVDTDPAVWIPALSHTPIYSLGAAGDLRSNDDLAALAADHPELRSLFIGWSRGITDLTPLLALENLESVTINRDMERAIASLDGQEYGFRLELQ